MKDFTVKVPGVDFELSSNSIYHIREVSDPHAPDGFQKKGISKHPLPGIEEGIVVPHHELTNTWDTGFWEGSACLKKEKKQVADSIFNKVTKYLLPELEYLVDGDLTNGRSSNNAFFDEFIPFNSQYGEDKSKYKIKGGNMFNTSNPLEFLALWWALIGKQIIPSNSKTYNTKCSFVLEDKKQTTSLEQDREYDKTLALATVMGVMKNKESKKEIAHLQNIFKYVGLAVDLEETQVKPLISIFTKWCEKGGYNNDNAVEFNEVFSKFESEESREELVVYSKLLDYIKEGKVLVERRDIFIDKINLGSDKKSAARKIVSDQELHKKFLLI